MRLGTCYDRQAASVASVLPRYRLRVAVYRHGAVCTGEGRPGLDRAGSGRAPASGAGVLLSAAPSSSGLVSCHHQGDVPQESTAITVAMNTCCRVPVFRLPSLSAMARSPVARRAARPVHRVRRRNTAWLTVSRRIATRALPGPAMRHGRRSYSHQCSASCSSPCVPFGPPPPVRRYILRSWPAGYLLASASTSQSMHIMWWSWRA